MPETRLDPAAASRGSAVAPAIIQAADHAARHWRAAAASLPIGSDAHRSAVYAMFRDTFNPYKPSVIDWPKLDREAQDRLTSLPIWDIAVQTEGKARLRMAAYARHVPDPEWQAAISQNAWEEGRHKEVLSNLVSTASPWRRSLNTGNRRTPNGPTW